MVASPARDSFLELAQSDSSTRSAALARAASELFIAEASPTATDITQYQELILNLLPDLPLRDRRHIAALIVGFAATPKDVLAWLSKDDISVSALVLGTNRLDEADLLDLVTDHRLEHSWVIANSCRLTANLSQALIQSEDPNVVAALCQRADLDLSVEMVGLISSLSQLHPVIASALARRVDMPFQISASAMVGLDHGARLALIEKSKQAALIEQAQGRKATRRRTPNPELARRFTSLAIGRNHDGMVDIIADELRVPPEFAEEIVSDPGGEVLAIAMKALWVDAKTALTIFLQAGPSISRSEDTLRRLNTLYNDLTTLAAEQFVSAWQVGQGKPDYAPYNAADSASDRGTGRHLPQTSTAGNESDNASERQSKRA